MIPEERQAELVAELRSGSRLERRRAGEELFRATEPGLYQLALRLTGRPALADDAVQETFVEVLRSIQRFRAEAKLTTWMFRIAVRAALRARGRGRRETQVAGGPNPLGREPAPEEVLARREGAERVLAAIGDLSAPLAAAFSLSAVEGLARREIAEVLGVPPGTVDSRIAAARQQLKERLGRPD